MTTLTEIKPYLEKFTTKETDINLATEVFRELRIWGDDLDEMLGEIERDFDADFSRIPLPKYAPQEGFNPITAVCGFLGLRRFKSLTVDMIVSSARSGIWLYD